MIENISGHKNISGSSYREEKIKGVKVIPELALNGKN